MDLEMQRIKQRALMEFAALATLEEYLGIPLLAKEVKRKAIRDFKKSVKNNITLMEFDQNKKHFKTIMPEVSAVAVDENDKIISEYTVRKKSKELSAKAKRRVDAKVSAYQAIFKMPIDGASFEFESETVQQRAIYHLEQYKAHIELIKPTKQELIRAFLTWIRDTNNLTNDEAVKEFITFNIPTVNKYIISDDWKELQPNTLTFRTFYQ